MNTRDDDQPETRIAEAYRQSAQELPDADLDARILATAHRAVASRPQARPAAPNLWWRYRTPFATAAVIVLCVTISLQLKQQPPGDAVMPPLPEAALPVPAAETFSADKKVAPDMAPASRSATVEDTAAPPESAESKTTLDTMPEQRKQGAEMEPPPAAAPMRDDQFVADPPAVSSEATADEAASAKSAEAPTEPATPADTHDAEISTQVIPATRADQAVEERREEVARAKMAPAAAPLPPSAAEMAPAAAPASGAMLRDAELSGMEKNMEKDAAAPAKMSVGQWLAHIRALRAAGKYQTAAQSLREFTQAYPDVPVPEDLLTR